MASMHSRYTPSPSSPAPGQGSKLSRFLHRQSSRDRSRSTDSIPVGATQETSSTRYGRKASRFLNSKEKGDKSSIPNSPAESATHSPDPTSPAIVPTNFPASETVEDPPVIIEHVVPRPRTRSERPLSSASDVHPSVSLYSSTSSTTRISDLPTRLSGWFSHTFSTSSTDLSLPNLLSQTSHLSTASPRSKGAALLAAAKQGKGHLDKAVRYLLDSDSTPDKCTDPIWLLGVQHSGYEPPSPMPLPATPTTRRSSADARKFGSSASFRSSNSSPSPPADQSLLLSQSQPALSKQPCSNWPSPFYIDFTSRIWLTYRSQFQPIRDTSLTALDSDGDTTASTSSSPILRRWHWGGDKGWSSDQGWGCMLRTGQSLLANALLHLHLGRDWRRPPCPVYTADYALYVQILTWFLDSPLPLAPFSVHRMALAGKELGKDVGQWFGPSTAAGAIKRLVRAFPSAGLGVVVATDSAVFQSDVYEASHPPDESPRRQAQLTWGGRAVLILIGVRLGLDGVNPIYYDTIKALYAFPQSVGIAGGRPSSSYYFVGTQADNLFYLDPHHTRTTIPLRPPPLNRLGREATPESDRERDDRDRAPFKSPRSPSSSHHRGGTYASSIRTGSSTYSHYGLMSPSPLQQQLSISSASTSSSVSPASSSQQHLAQPNAVTSISRYIPAESSIVNPDADHREFGIEILGTSDVGSLDITQEHYTRAYSAAELKTFHCERVRKMPLSGLDPSMLIGFLCKDEDDWLDFRQRVVELSRNHKTIFSVQDEPPSWPSDSDDNMGLESLSEPDEIDIDLDEPQEAGDGDSERFFDTGTKSASTSSGGRDQGLSKSEEVDTEEDPIDPITPGPGARTFDQAEEEAQRRSSGAADTDLGKGAREVLSEGDIVEIEGEDDWVDPSLPTPLAQPWSTLSAASPPLPHGSTVPAKGKSSGKRGKKGKKNQLASAVPIVKTPIPPVDQEKQHFPFPMTQRVADDALTPMTDDRPHAIAFKGKRMHTAKARDGGRTQSGGVKGVLPTDDC